MGETPTGDPKIPLNIRINLVRRVKILRRQCFFASKQFLVRKNLTFVQVREDRISFMRN